MLLVYVKFRVNLLFPTLQLIVIPPYMTVRAHFKTRWRSSYKTENHNVLKQLPWDL